MISKLLQRYFNLSNIQAKRFTLNLTSRSSSFFFKILIQILFPPLMIMAWGIENFGIWLFLLSLPSLLSAANINFSASIQQEMIYFYNQNNPDKVKTIFQIGNLLSLITITVFLILSSIFYFSSDFNFKATENIPLDVLKMCFIIVVFTICLNILDGIFISAISIKGKIYIVDYNRIIFDTILKTSLVASGLFFDNFFVMVLIFLILKIVQTIFFYFFYTIHKDYLKISFNKFSKKKLFRQLKLSISYNIELVKEVINNNGLLFILGIFFNSGIVALVSTSKTLFYFLPRQLFNNLNHVSIYEYTSLFANQEFEKLRYFFKKHLLFVLIASVLFVLFSTILGPSVYNLWLDSKLDANHNLIYLLILIAFFEVIFETLLAPQKSLNQFFKLSFAQLIASGTALLLSILLYYLSFELIVYFYILLICYFFLTIYSIFQVNSFFNLKIEKL